MAAPVTTISSYGRVNVMSGGEGNDTFDLDGSHAVNTITGGAGQNTYINSSAEHCFGNIDITNYTEQNIVTDFKAGDGGDIIRMPNGGGEGEGAIRARLPQSRIRYS